MPERTTTVTRLGYPPRPEVELRVTPAADAENASVAVHTHAPEVHPLPALRVPRPRPRARSAAAHWVRAVARDALAPLHTTPDVVLVGAPGCGSEDLFAALGRHPGVLVPSASTGYFDARYGEGRSWYLRHLPTRRAVAAARERHGAAVVVDHGPGILFHPLAATRMAADLPGVRLVVVLRDPVERAVAAHAEAVRRGVEDLPLEAALAAEPVRLAAEGERMAADPGYAGDAWRHQGYVAHGRYAAALERLEDLVGRDRLLVLDGGAVDAQAAAVRRFAGLPSAAPCTEPASRAPSPPAAVPVPAAVRRRLTEEFTADDERLAAWLGRPPSWRA